MPMKDTAQDSVKDRRKCLEQAEKALELVGVLPQELQDLEGGADTNYDGTLSIYLYRYSNKDVDLLKVCKMAGVQGLVTKMSSPENWYAEGEMQIGEVKVEVRVSGLEKPPSCIIESYQETVTKYKAICTETGKVIG